MDKENEEITHAIIMHPDDLKNKVFGLMKSLYVKKGEPCVMDLSALPLKEPSELKLPGIAVTDPEIARMEYRLKFITGF